ncbi:transcriptional regulator, GntR family [Clostridium carboxidivorans P7]|uniref:Transcriptional regulator, GntR family n=1 Tax=Clostridium carboxidivorans P7 TaxID=536227 RepID=C6PXC1_9CLOT|nr:transcriptional regulator, GntR family [Clostridium carboxidivorans P7]
MKGAIKKETWDTICQVEADFQRIRLLSLSLKLKLDNVYSQHLVITDAIRDKKLDIADKVMREHLIMVNFDSVKLKEKYQEYFK